MAKVIVSVEQMGLKIPILIGGATTSDMHTASNIFLYFFLMPYI